MKLEYWSIVYHNPYAAPETQAPSLRGHVFGHPRFTGGKLITTSPITRKNNRDEIVTETGSSYELGVIDRAYDIRFPGARKILLDRLSCKPDTKEGEMITKV